MTPPRSASTFIGSTYAVEPLEMPTITAARWTVADHSHGIADARMLLAKLGIGTDVRVLMVEP